MDLGSPTAGPGAPLTRHKTATRDPNLRLLRASSRAAPTTSSRPLKSSDPSDFRRTATRAQGAEPGARGVHRTRTSRTEVNLAGYTARVCAARGCLRRTPRIELTAIGSLRWALCAGLSALGSLRWAHCAGLTALGYLCWALCVGTRRPFAPREVRPRPGLTAPIPIRSRGPSGRGVPQVMEPIRPRRPRAPRWARQPLRLQGAPPPRHPAGGP